MTKTGTAQLAFDATLNKTGRNKELRQGLSVAVQVGTSLWVANDETVSLERLTLQKAATGGPLSFAQHKRFLLKDFLLLPARPSAEDMAKGKVVEADLEGMDYRDGYLWIIGSHSLKRKKPEKDNPEKDNLKDLAKVSSDGNRFLLARIPMVKEGDSYTLKQEAGANGRRLTAAQLAGNDKGSELTAALQKDEHLGPFLPIPGKDNGFDIEGLAVWGSKLFIGLRGPVLRGWSVVLELELSETARGKRTELKIEKLKKHFLQMDGLGVRDLCVQGNDLLILAGPTMELDGPVTVYRWKEALLASKKDFVFREELVKVLDVPFGRGDDHAEGLTLFSSSGDDKKDALLVVYDAAAKSRMTGDSGMTTDVFGFG